MNEPGELEKIINDAENEPVLRLEVLAQLAETMGRPAARSGESNNHIHTCYSFSPYTPSGAASTTTPTRPRAKCAPPVPC